MYDYIMLMLELHSYIIYTILTPLVLILFFICLNLYKKIRIYETWAINTRDKVDKLKDSVTEIDSRGIFEKDDDVGFVYDGISSLIKDFDPDIDKNE